MEGVDDKGAVLLEAAVWTSEIGAAGSVTFTGAMSISKETEG